MTYKILKPFVVPAELAYNLKSAKRFSIGEVVTLHPELAQSLEKSGLIESVGEPECAMLAGPAPKKRAAKARVNV
jgi:hypothetical protein